MNKNILITGVGGDIGRSILRCLLSSYPKEKVVGTDVDAFSAGRTLVGKFLIAPPAKDEEAYKRFIRKSIQDDQIEIICPTTEPEIALFNKNRKEFSDVSPMIQSETVLTICSDKLETANWLKENGFPYPRSFRLSDYENDAFPWPVILKERNGCGSKSLYLVHSIEELKVLGKKLANPMVQECIGTPEEEYTVGVFSNGEEVREIQFQRTLGFGGLSRKAIRVEDKALSLLVCDIAKKMKLKGSINIQLRKKNNQFVTFEINPRLSSTAFIRHCIGFKDLTWWLELSLGQKVSPYVKSAKPVVAIRTVEEMFFDMDGNPWQ